MRRARTGRRREKVFGPGRAIPLDKNAKARVWAYAQGYTALHRRQGQHRGPLTRATLDVLRALLWGFHNAQTGRCFPSYEAIAEKAKVHRSTVALAITALEAGGVMTWENRLVRQRVAVPGLER
ncbi:MAG: helix-turn-helix domain-containing protein, partial [Janthinobacterium lividum]